VIAVLQPGLLKVKKWVDEDVWYNFKIPFDPHEIKYWNYNIDFMEQYKELERRLELPEGVRKQVVKEKDISIDPFGNERTKYIRVCYFMTYRDFNCNCGEEYEQRTNQSAI
jgi:hypothetical protein